MACTVDVISIGTLSRNPFWSEQGTVRPAHATTTLIRDGTLSVLVDPSLPPELLAHRLDERTGLKPGQIDSVVLTNFRPVHRRSLELFDEATWWIGPDERQAIASHLNAALEEHRLADQDDQAPPLEIEQELALLGRTEAAGEQLSPNVHLFPSPGASPGSISLLIAGVKTVVVAGDAILTRDHFENGRVFERSADPTKARESFADIVEVAEIIVPGHDNLIMVT